MGIQFTGSSTPPNCGGTVAYLWNFGDGSGTSTFLSPLHTYTSTGTFSWTLTSSVNGVTCTQTGTITISAATTCSLACTATVPSTAVQGTPVSFAGTATPSNCTGSASYMWNFGDGSTPATTQNATHTYASAGTFNWTLTISIGSVTCTRTGTITITPATGCVVNCTATVPTSARRGTSITFTGTSTRSNCPSDQTLRYRWTFGDGSTSSSRIAAHTYSSSGTYAWTLTVTYGTATCRRTGSISIIRSGD